MKRIPLTYKRLTKQEFCERVIEEKIPERKVTKGRVSSWEQQVSQKENECTPFHLAKW